MPPPVTDVDPRSIVPLRVHPHFKYLSVTSKDIEEVILNTDGLRSTYIFCNFDGIHVTRQIPSSVAMVNKRTRRLAVMVNPDFVRKLVIADAIERLPRQNRSVPRSQEFMRYSAGLETRAAIHEATWDVLRRLITHEFSHIWFAHLERDSGDSHFLQNLAHDAMINYHMGLDFRFDWADRYKSDELFINSLCFVRWMVAGSGDKFEYRDSDADHFLKVMDHPNPETLSDRNYVAWRCLHTLYDRVAEGTTKTQMIKGMLAYLKAIDGYRDTVSRLIVRLVKLFPELEEHSQSPMHPPPGPTRSPPKTPSDLKNDQDDEQQGKPEANPEEQDDLDNNMGYAPVNEPAEGEEEPQEVPPVDAKDETEKPDPGEDAPSPEVPDCPPEQLGEIQIDPHTQTVDIDGDTYLPLDDHDIPPDFDQKIPEVVRSCGGSRKFVEAVVKDIEQAKLSKETVKAVLKHATKSLLRQARKALDLNRRPDKVATSIVPSRRPILSDMALNNTLQLNRLPRYRPSTARMEDIKKKKVAIFLDVSGSMMSAWTDIISFCWGLSKEADLIIHQFSTSVEKVTLDEIKDGVVRTRGGTNVSPVVEKIVELSRICDSFVVLGDREYSGYRTVPKVAQPIKLLDINYCQRNTVCDPWFQTTDRCMVHYADLGEDFEVLREGAVCDNESRNKRRKELRKIVRRG
jgi:hypothetical protein